MVGGSTPSPATSRSRRAALLLLCLPWVMAATCGDKCEALCRDVSVQLEACKPSSLTWPDLGARSRVDFVTVCRRQWERERRELSSSELAVALEFCDDSAAVDLSCEELIALYGPSP